MNPLPGLKPREWVHSYSTHPKASSYHFSDRQGRSLEELPSAAAVGGQCPAGHRTEAQKDQGIPPPAGTEPHVCSEPETGLDTMGA